MKLTITSSLILLNLFSTSLAHPAISPWNERGLALENRAAASNTTGSGVTSTGSTPPATTARTTGTSSTPPVTTARTTGTGSTLPATTANANATSSAPPANRTPLATNGTSLNPPATATSTFGGVYRISADCLKDNQLLRGDSMSSNRLVPDECARFCAERAFKWFGVKDGSTCMCDSELRAAKTPSSGCNTPCSGDGNASCGGAQKLTLYVDPIDTDFPSTTASN